MSAAAATFGASTSSKVSQSYGPKTSVVTSSSSAGCVASATLVTDCRCCCGTSPPTCGLLCAPADSAAPLPAASPSGASLDAASRHPTVSGGEAARRESGLELDPADGALHPPNSTTSARPEADPGPLPGLLPE